MDSDMHVVEPSDMWERYIDEEFRLQAPSTVANPDIPVDIRLEFAGRTFTRTNIYDDASRHTYLMRRQKVAPKYADMAARGFDPVSQLKAMDIEGIDVAVLFPTKGLLVPWVDSIDPGLAMAVCRAYNDWLFDFCREDPGRLKGVAQVSLHDEGLAIIEAERAVQEFGMVGVWTRPNPVNGRNLHDPSLYPFWAQMEKLNVPVCFHSGEGPYMPSIGADRFPGNWMMAHTADHSLEMMLAMQSLILGGVLEKFPMLKVAFLEANCAWVPWWLWRMGEHYELVGEWDAPVPLTLTPLEYFQRQCYVSMDADEEPALNVLHAIGENRVVFSTDYPHGDSKFPNSVDIFLDMRGISDSLRRKILWDNCASLYNIRS
jgi:predicted TIM-barrel fold metal-dependent hydrolase